MEQALTTQVSESTIAFDEIYNRTHINQWIYENLPAETINMDVSNQGNDFNAEDDTYFRMGNMNKLITDIRTTIQVRKLEPNPS